MNLPKSRATIAQALVDAGDVNADRAEPSWAILGRIMQDTFFAHAHRRALFMAFMWGIGDDQVAPYAEAAKTLIGDHPYMPVIEAYAAAHDPPRFAEAMQRVKYGDATIAMLPLAAKVSGNAQFNIAGSSLWHILNHSHDDLAADKEAIVAAYR